jgi:hypothetical protein
MSDAPLIQLIRAEMQRFTRREYQIAFGRFDARSLQEMLRFLIDAEYEHYGFVTQDLEQQAVPASPHETIERLEPKLGQTLSSGFRLRQRAPRPARQAASGLSKAS